MISSYEKALVGGVLEGGELPSVHVLSSDISDPILSTLWRAISSVGEENRPIVTATIEDALSGLSLGTDARLEMYQMLEGLPDSANVDWYAKQVIASSKLRQLKCRVESIFTEGNEFISAAEKIEDVISSLLKGEWTGFKHIHTFAEEHIKDLEKGGLSGLRTGFEGLDRNILGLRNGHLYIIGGRPSNGKTLLALSIALSLAKENHNVAYFLLETSGKQIASRSLAIESRLPSVKFLRKDVNTQEDWARIAEVVDGLENTGIYVDESSGLSTTNLRSRIIRAREEFNPVAIIIDYIQLVDSKGTGEREKMNLISSTLRKLAKEMNLPIIGLSQLSRTARYERPGLHHLKESGNIEADADVALLVFRHAELAKDAYEFDRLNRHVNDIKLMTNMKPTEEVIWVDIAKNRQSGMLETVPFLFDRPTGFLRQSPMGLEQ